MKVLSVASELFPLVKTGGLADVVGALPAALAPFGIDMRTLVPGYPAVITALETPRCVAMWPELLGGPARLLSARSGSLDLFVVDAPHLYRRPGNPYVDASGRDWPDNAERFAALALAAARIAWGEVDAALIQFVPDLIHGHDWQAALVPVYLEFAGHGRRRPATVLTIHNIAFQGQFPRDAASLIGLPADAYASHGIEYFGDVGYLKGGILFADAITTVSPTYAREILTPGNGMGMDAMLRWRGAAVSGIVNGIDTEIWNPATDRHLVSRFDLHDLDRRKANKRAVEARFDLPSDDGPLLCMVTRLTTQKGIDLVADGLDALVELGVRLVVLGAGDARFEQALIDGAKRYPTRVACRIGYDEGLSHLMQGGSDAILIPSRFEPCGLTQLYGLRYGCVPIASRVGGLADTVVDATAVALAAGAATGIQFDDITAHGVVEAVRRLVELQAQPEVWRALQKNGMRSDLGWTNSAKRYARLYESLLR